MIYNDLSPHCSRELMNICDHNTFPEVILLDVTETFLYIEI